MKKLHVSVAVAALLALGACSKSGTDQTQNVQADKAGAPVAPTGEGEMTPAEKLARAAGTKSADDAPYRLDLPLNEFMPHVMQYAGDGIWKRQGYIIDKEGEHSLFPKNDDDWLEAESAALALAEMTNVLLIPGRRVPDPKWDEAVLKVRSVALKAAAAAEKKDPDAWFAAGGELDEACDVCHVQFDPTFKGKPQP
jgi:hypothetical protein